ncbi:hypothetical protein BH09SUM1_BH09SUM1_04130 [soil metagenome]
MKSSRARLSILLLSGTILFTPFLNGCMGQRIRSLKTDKEMLEARVMQLRQDMEALREEKGTTASDSGVQAEVDEKNRTIDSLKADLAKARSEAQSSSIATSQSRASSGELERARTDAANARTDADASKRNAQDIQTRLDSAQKELTTLKQNGEQKSNDSAGLQKRVDDLTAQLTKAESERDALTASTAAAKESVAKAPAIDPALMTLAGDQVISVESKGSQLHITILNDNLFKTGSVDISDAGSKTLETLAQAIKNTPHESLMLVGHSDDTPVKALPYPDNWDLSAARASQVLRALVKFGVDPAKASTGSRAFYEPAVENTDAASRRLNRRIEIIMDAKPPA